MVSSVESTIFQILVRDSKQPRALAGLPRALRRTCSARGKTPLALKGGAPPESNAEIPPDPKREVFQAQGKVLPEPWGEPRPKENYYQSPRESPN